MRTWVAVLGSLALLVGFAASARATAIIDLLWLGSASNTSIGAGADTITLGADLSLSGGTLLNNIPEPSTASLLALGLGGLYAIGRPRQN